MIWLRYVIHSEVQKFEAQGWINTGTMLAHHGHYAVLMQWEGQNEPG